MEWGLGLTSSWRTNATSESYMMTQPGLQSHSAPSLRLSRAWKLTASSRELPQLGACSAAPALSAPFAMSSLFTASEDSAPGCLLTLAYYAHIPFQSALCLAIAEDIMHVIHVCCRLLHVCKHVRGAEA